MVSRSMVDGAGLNRLSSASRAFGPAFWRTPRTSLSASFFHRSASRTWPNAKASFGTAARSGGNGLLPDWARAAAPKTRPAVRASTGRMGVPSCSRKVRDHHSVVLLDDQLQNVVRHGL